MFKKPRYFYGWNVVAASFLAHMSYAEHHTSMLGFFFRPLQQEFGWTRGAVAAAQTIARVTEALIAPLVGPLIDRYGPRVLMPIGAIVVGFTMLLITQVNSIWQFYLLRGAMAAMGFAFMGSLVTDVTINKWFIRKRGRAIALGRIGGSISNTIFVPVTVFVLAASGWRTMFVVFALVTWVFVLVPSAILMRRRPEDMGLRPDGVAPPPPQAPGPGPKKPPGRETNLTAERGWTRREAVATRTFWTLAICFAIDSLAFHGITISLAAYVQDLGYSDVSLTAAMTFRAIVMATCYPLMGFVAEHTDRVAFRVAPFIIESIGAFLFLLAGQPVFLWSAIAAYSVGVIGVIVTQEVTWANYFGRLSLGRVRSLAFLVSFGFGAAGPLAMNLVFDRLGSYRPAFVVIMGLFLVAGFLMATVRPARR